MTNRPVHGIPEFQIAQQAIGYLELSLTQGQLRMLFPRQGAAEEFLEILADAASRADETEAILASKGMEGMFRAATWAQVATPEQMITGRFIIGRAALLRVRATAAATAIRASTTHAKGKAMEASVSRFGALAISTNARTLTPIHKTTGRIARRFLLTSRMYTNSQTTLFQTLSHVACRSRTNKTTAAPACTTVHTPPVKSQARN